MILVPQDVLTKAGVETLKESKHVGENLYDAPVFLRPKSTGCVTITSGSVWDSAVIEANDPNKIKTLVQGARIAPEIAQTKPLADN
ncbi:hypothetical protein RSOL_226990, partial [Rhizoctonia solani AG-3 Rhs1AP]